MKKITLSLLALITIFAFAGCKEPSLEETLTVPVEKASDFTLSEGTWNLTQEETASEEGLGSSSTIVKGTYVVTGTNPTSAINATVTSYIEKMVAETKEAYTEAKTYVIVMEQAGFTADYDEDNLTITITANEATLKKLSDQGKITYEVFSKMLTDYLEDGYKITTNDNQTAIKMVLEEKGSKETVLLVKQ